MTKSTRPARPSGHRRPRLLAAAVVASFFGFGCSQNSFTGNNASPRSSTSSSSGTGTSTDPAGLPSNQTVSVPVGSQQADPGLPANSGATCVSADPTTAVVNQTTCQITGIKPGTTTVTATLPNGQTVTTTVQVTPTSANAIAANPTIGGTTGGATSGPSIDKGSASGSTSPGISTGDGTIAVAGGTLTTSDGIITAANGMLCLGGPACNVSYLLQSQDQATLCMQTANPLPCANDAKCGPQFKLQLCNCNCANSAGLTFDDPTTCRRYNPLQAGGLPGHPECTK